MHGPDGADYPNWIEWREIEPPDRLVFLHGDRPDDPRAFVSTVTLIERYHAIEGGRQTLGRLALHVATLIRTGR